jgi:hypothetical protein
LDHPFGNFASILSFIEAIPAALSSESFDLREFVRHAELDDLRQCTP